MPNRILRDWTDSDRLDGISAEAERLFIRLIMKADDYGRFHAEARRLRSACFPLILDLRPTDIDRWLAELSERGLILRYRADNRDLLAVDRFRQRLKKSIAKFPSPPGKSHDWQFDSGNFRELPGTSGNFPPETETETETETQAAAPPEKPPPPRGEDENLVEESHRLHHAGAAIFNQFGIAFMANGSDCVGMGKLVDGYGQQAVQQAAREAIPKLRKKSPATLLVYVEKRLADQAIEANATEEKDAARLARFEKLAAEMAAKRKAGAA